MLLKRSEWCGAFPPRLLSLVPCMQTLVDLFVNYDCALQVSQAALHKGCPNCVLCCLLFNDSYRIALRRRWLMLLGELPPD